jgi:DNA-binding XRE family transcriptional regulator
MKGSTMSVETIVQNGRERVILDREVYQDLLDARDHAIAMREVATGETETVPDAEVDQYLAAPTPLAFWRKKRGYTQASLAVEMGVSQPFIAQMEGGQRIGDVATVAKLARLLKLRIEDLLADE